jgi:anti-sigma B factor antagonist
MKLQIEDEILRVTGVRELGAHTALSFRDQVRAAMVPSVKAIEIDLSRTSFVDSCGLGALIAILKSARNQNATVRLVNPTAAIKQILEMTRLHRLFEVMTTAVANGCSRPIQVACATS